LTRETSRRNWRVAGICALLVILVFTVFWQTVGYGFADFDDDLYVYQNPMVLKGISLEGIGWAITHVVAGNWHPLTILLHMLDCQMYGLWAGGHHLTNVCLHAACSALLFLLLLEMTGKMWRSGFVAAVFAIHPLRVESVAWVSELKDVLSGVFFMLTLWAYVRYTRQDSKGRYAMVLLWFALGLLSKPMLVTIPFVLLLLDYWPLGRFQNRSQLPGLLREKIPLFALSAASCVATVLAQRQAIQSIEHFSLSLRIGNALVACVVYVGKLIWPTHLAILYPLLKDGVPAWQVIDATLLLMALTAGAWLLRRGHPYVIVGWLWYLGMLAPVIGILQVGHQAYADRYTYLPQIGLCIAGAWMAADWAGRRRGRRAALGGIALVILCVLPVAAWHQTTYWRDNETLWTHDLACTRENWAAHNNLGMALYQRGSTEEAMAQFREALRLDPDNAQAHTNLGNTLLREGYTEEAIAEYREAFKIDPAEAEAHYDLGNALLQQGRTEEAIAQFREAIRIDPADANAHSNLGVALMQQGHNEEAIAQFREAVRINPALADAHCDLGLALFQDGRIEEAIAQVERALDLQPADVTIQNKLAWMLATAPQPSLRDGARAVELATRASQSSGGNSPAILRTLAAAYAEAGQFPAAIQAAQRALQLAQRGGGEERGTEGGRAAQSNTALANALPREINLYEAGRSFEEAR
jgi:tetratricopeptide (TPR) repeat protein